MSTPITIDGSLSIGKGYSPTPTRNGEREEVDLSKQCFGQFQNDLGFDHFDFATAKNNPPKDTHAASHSGLLEPRGTSTVRKDPGVAAMTTWSVSP